MLLMKFNWGKDLLCHKSTSHTHIMVLKKKTLIVFQQKQFKEKSWTICNWIKNKKCNKKHVKYVKITQRKITFHKSMRFYFCEIKY